MNQTVGSFVTKYVPCPDQENCGSSDACSIRADGSALCFSCKQNFPNYNNSKAHRDWRKEQEEAEINSELGRSEDGLTAITNIRNSSYNELTDRNISLEIAKRYRVKSQVDQDKGEEQEGKVLKHFYPYFRKDKLVFLVTRTVNDKSFKTAGSTENLELFGEHLFGNGGKSLVITEGECDAMAAYDMLNQRIACVSIRGGVTNAVKHVRERIEFIEKFEEVVFCFDQDKYGTKVTEEVAQLVIEELIGIITPNKVKVMSLPGDYKDPNAMLLDDRRHDFEIAHNDAQAFTPVGVYELYGKKEEWLNRGHKPSVSYPWVGLNNKLRGMRLGELVTLTGGTGLGKSSVTREIEHHLIKKTTDKVGIIALEENWERTADGIVSIEADARLYLNDVREAMDKKELSKVFDKAIPEDRVYIHAHHGVTNINEIFRKLKHIIIAKECKWLIVDHLHMMINVLKEEDERRGIDTLMNKLRSLVEETGIGMILVAHLRRAQGDKGHENGVQVSLAHLKGSQGIAQLSDCVIALERNQQADNSEEANTTQLRVLKSRYTGDTGLACGLKYDPETGRLTELGTGEEF